MTLPIIVGPAAADESDEAAAWYEQQAKLGKSFVEQLDSAFQRIAKSPELHPTIYRDVRRARVQRFPYSVFYRVLTDRVEVIAVLHSKRNPDIWRSRA